MPRSAFRSLIGAVLLAAATAQAFPEKSITILMPFAPGSSTDVIARDFAQVLSDVVKKPVVVENKVGAEGVIAGVALANSQGDGHTMMFTSSSLPVLDPLMKKSLPYDPVKDFVAICSFARVTNVMNVTGSSPFKTAAEVIAAAKAQPDKLTFAYTSTTTRLAAELFQQAAGIKLRGVPYKSSVGALADVSGGQVDLVFIDPITGIPFYESKKLRPLLIAGSQRIKSLPDVPAASEVGIPGYNVKPWYGLFATGKTPPAVVARVREAVLRAMKMPAAASIIEKRGLDPMPMCGDEVVKYQTDEIEFWRGVIKKAGIEPQ